MFNTLHNVRWAADAKRAAVELVEHIDTFYFVIHVPVAQQLLDGRDVLYPFQQLGGASWPKSSVAELPGMPEAVDTGRFVDTGHQHRSPYSFPKQAQTQMVPALLARMQAIVLKG
jgi:hypothetical protein